MGKEHQASLELAPTSTAWYAASGTPDKPDDELVATKAYIVKLDQDITDMTTNLQIAEEILQELQGGGFEVLSVEPWAGQDVASPLMGGAMPSMPPTTPMLPPI